MMPVKPWSPGEVAGKAWGLLVKWAIAQVRGWGGVDYSARPVGPWSPGEVAGKAWDLLVKWGIVN
jgi:hypothetical protein